MLGTSRVPFMAVNESIFCSQACLRVFEQQPDSFMTGEIEHPKKDD
jgi:hypothetical protein